MAMASSRPTTDTSKKNRGIWLIGSAFHKVTGSKLPSNRQVLGRFFHVHSHEKHTIQTSAITAAREVQTFWGKARIPIRLQCHVVTKIKKLHSTWQNLKKSAGRRTEAQMAKEDAFVSTLDDLFDVAHADAMTLIKIPEDREFLTAQREPGRRGSMGPVDTKLAKQEKLRHQKELRKINLETLEADRLMTENATAQLTSSEESSSDDDADDACLLLGPSAKKSCRGRPSSMVTPEVAAALDRTRISNRNATYVLTAAAQSLGHNPADMAINRESIRQARRRNRENIAREIQASFSPDVPLTVHWDGKLLPALTSKETVDRLAVLVSGEGTMKLLGVPAMHNGTGEAQAAAVFKLVEEWNLTNRLQCMSFDTTASNTGLVSGACVLLENKLKRKLLSLACRHHIHELIVAKVFSLLMETTSNGPNIKLFERFSKAWSSIDRESSESAMTDVSVAALLEPWREDMIRFCLDQLIEVQPREDYKELLHLALLFLGAPDDHPRNILAPGAFDRARWMAKLIYCLKIYLFRSQFHLTPRELAGLRDFNIFVVQIYLKAWYRCQCPVLAPLNDLELLKQFAAYDTNQSVAKAAMKSFTSHLWYLSETLIGLAFFDSRVSDEVRVTMVKAMERSSSDEPQRRIKIDEKHVSGMQLYDFVTHNTKKLFEALQIPMDFLLLHPSTWEEDEGFLTGKRKLQQLKVVNDAAERGVALIQSFNAVLTNQEDQKQYLLQLVEKHRKDYPDSNKATIVRGQV